MAEALSLAVPILFLRSFFIVMLCREEGKGMERIKSNMIGVFYKNGFYESVLSGCRIASVSLR